MREETETFMQIFRTGRRSLVLLGRRGCRYPNTYDPFITLILTNDSPHYHYAVVPLNKEEKILAIEKLVTQTEIHSTKDACAGHIAPTEPVSSEVARTGRLRRSTFTKNIVEKATIGGTSGAFAPTLIQNTLQLSRMKFTA